MDQTTARLILLGLGQPTTDEERATAIGAVIDELDRVSAMDRAAVQSAAAWRERADRMDRLDRPEIARTLRECAAEIDGEDR